MMSDLLSYHHTDDRLKADLTIVDLSKVRSASQAHRVRMSPIASL